MAWAEFPSSPLLDGAARERKEHMGEPISVLVTGAAGRVGQAACEGLLARGHKVRAFDVRPSPGVEDAIVGDVSVGSRVAKAMELF